MDPTRPSSESGFGLIEVLISMLLLIVAATGGLAMLASTIYITQFSGTAQTATALAQDITDRSSLESYATLGTAGVSVCPATSPAASGCVDGTAGTPPACIVKTINKVDFTRKCLVTVGLNNIKTVAVSVSWSDAKVINSDNTVRTRTINVGVQRAP